MHFHVNDNCGLLEPVVRLFLQKTNFSDSLRNLPPQEWAKFLGSLGSLGGKMSSLTVEPDKQATRLPTLLPQ
jgi:hypothetical protein